MTAETPPNSTDTAAADSDSAAGPAAGPTIVSIDDVAWVEVKAQSHDGRRVSIWEKFLEWTPERMVIYARYDPGVVVEKHGHASDHYVFVLSGEVAIGDRICGPGTSITLPLGAVFGVVYALVWQRLEATRAAGRSAHEQLWILFGMAFATLGIIDLLLSHTTWTPPFGSPPRHDALVPLGVGVLVFGLLLQALIGSASVMVSSARSVCAGRRGLWAAATTHRSSHTVWGWVSSRGVLSVT